MLSLFLFPGVFSVYADDYEPADEPTNSTNEFILDADDTGGDITIQFGGALGEFLKYDAVDLRFELSDPLSLEGNELEDFRIENLASDPACGAGNTGRVYYNTGSNSLLYCDGTSYGALGGGVSEDQTNVVYVDSTRAAQVGEVYGTLADAIVYVNSETPGIANRWVIMMEPGLNAETVTIPEYTLLMSRDQDITTFTGTLTLSSNSIVQGITAITGEIDIGSGLVGYVRESDVNLDDGVGGGIDGTLVVSDSFIDGEISATGAVMAYNSTIGATGLVNEGTLGTYHSTVLTLTNNNMWDNFGTAYNNATSGLTATNTQAAIDELRTSNTFTINSDDAGSDQVQLNFGTPEFLLWDDINDYFFISDALVVDGNVNLQGTVLTLDSDQPDDVDVNVEIVAEQGNESNGIIRYDDGNNRWELSNDGGSFEAITTGSGVVTTDLAAVQARRTTNYTLTNAFVDITLNATDLENDAAVLEHNNGSTDRIDIKEDGIYLIEYRSQVEAGGAALIRAFAQVRLNDSTVIAGSEAEVDIWYDSAQNLNASFVVSLSTNDFVTLQLSKETTGDPATAISDTVFSVIKLEGIEGPQGPAGAGNTLDQAYDEGGAGAGRTITADSGVVDINGAGLEVDNVVLNDNTISSGDTNGNLALSPNGTGKLLFNAEVDFEDVTSDPGSPSEGTLWFRSDTDNLRFLADGRTQEIQTVAVAQAYESGTTTFDSATPIDWDGTNAVSRIVDPTFSHNTGVNPSRITVNDSGLYEVSYSIGWDTNSGSRRTATCDFRVNGALIATGVGISHDYSRNSTDNNGSNSSTFYHSFTGGQYYQIYCTSTGTAGSIVTVAGQSWTSIRLLRRQ